MAEKIISPGVFTRENDLSFVQTGVAAIGAAIVGPTVKGPNLIPTLVYSYSEYQALYGDAFKSGSNYYQYLTSITAKEYLKHGGPATIVRIMPTDAGNANSYTHLYPSGSLLSTPNALLSSITANPSDCLDTTYTGVPLASAGGGVGAIATITCSGTGQLLTGVNAILDAISTNTTTATIGTYTPAFATNGAGVNGAINVTVTSTGVLNHNSLFTIQTDTTNATDATYTGIALTGGAGNGAEATVEVVAGTITSVIITNGGTGYAAGNVLTIAATNLGLTSTAATFNALANANLFGTISGVTVTTAGTGYEELDTLTIAAGDLGTDSTAATFTLSGIGDMVGEIIGITITGVGQGYEAGDVLTIAANALGAGSTAGTITLQADDIFNGLSARSGVLTSGSTYAFPTTSFQMFTHTDGELMNSLPGSSLTSLAVASNDVFVSSSVAGVGTKFGTKNNIRWEVSNVNQKKGTFTLAIRRGDDSKKRKVILETWNNCSLDPNENNYIGAVIGTQRPTVGDSTTASPYIQPSGNYKNRSQFVYIDENTILNTIDYLDENGNIRDITATGSLPINGCSGSFFGGAEGTGWAGSANYYEASTAGNFQGLNISNVASTGYIAYECAFNLLSNQDEYDINLLIAPGITYQMSPALTNKMVTVCEERGDVMTIIDPVDYQTTNIASVVQQAENFDSSYAAMYWPWVQIADPATGKYIWVPQSVIMPSIYAFNDKVSAEWFAPAGLNRGGQETVVQAARKLTHANRDILYEGSVNPVATFPGEGVVVWGQKTLQKKSSALDRVNVRRLLINLKKFIASVSKYLLFENNTTSTRNRFLSQVNPYMESVQQRQGLYAFKVIMDETNNTPDIIDRNIMKGDIFIQPAKAAEFIVIDFNIMPTGATFND